MPLGTPYLFPALISNHPVTELVVVINRPVAVIIIDASSFEEVRKSGSQDVGVREPGGRANSPRAAKVSLIVTSCQSRSELGRSVFGGSVKRRKGEKQG